MKDIIYMAIAEELQNKKEEEFWKKKIKPSKEELEKIKIVKKKHEYLSN